LGRRLDDRNCRWLFNSIYKLSTFTIAWTRRINHNVLRVTRRGPEEIENRHSVISMGPCKGISGNPYFTNFRGPGQSCHFSWVSELVVSKIKPLDRGETLDTRYRGKAIPT